MSSLNKRIAVLIAFSIAMAALEGAVVVYLRALYYPGEFTVAMKLVEVRILLVELTREVATIIMLAAIAWLTGTSVRDRFSYFLISFAVWDIFYYVWLKVFIGWPVSLFDWDILFLIPFAWLGPVIAPIICSLTMIGFAIILLRNPNASIGRLTWSSLSAGCVLILFCFLNDYGSIIVMNGYLGDYFHLMDNPAFVALASTYVPDSFNWLIFAAGEALLLAAMSLEFKGISFRSKKTEEKYYGY